MTQVHATIVRPIETEKSVASGAGVYTFEVLRDASKRDIAHAVKKYYGVEVTAVRTMRTHEKKRSAGRREIVKRSEFKKAIVVTKDAKAIDINSIKIAA